MLSPNPIKCTIMNKFLLFKSIFTFSFLLPSMLCSAPNVAGISGSIQKTISNTMLQDPAKAPVLQWSVQELSGDAVFTGQVCQCNFDNNISFESSTDSSEATVNPLYQVCLISSVKTPILTSSLSGAGVGSIPITYAGTGFSTAPEIIIDYPTTGDDQATATASINGSGAISGISITTAGSGYSCCTNCNSCRGASSCKAY